MNLTDIRRVSAIKPDGMSAKATLRLLKRLHEKHGGILFRGSDPKGKWCVHVDRLKQIEPTWNARPWPTREEHEALRDRCAKIESELAFVRKRENALASSLRELRQAVSHIVSNAPESAKIGHENPKG